MALVTFDEAFSAVQERLGERDALHSLRVAQTAAGLAETYGADVEQARLAGLLHDWDRNRPPGELLGAALDAGMDVTPVDEAVPYLLHAYTGAAGLATVFPELPAEVLQAVARHTVGAPGMTDLDQVVYLADMIEPHREYPGVDKLRDAVGTASLDELFTLGYQLSLMHLVRDHRRIHPDTVDVWNGLVAGEQQ